MLFSLGTYGPLGVMSVVGFWLFLQERKRTADMTAKIGEYIRASHVADAEHTKAMSALSNLYDLGMKFTEATTNSSAAMTALKEAVERLEEEIRRSSNESKRR